MPSLKEITGDIWDFHNRKLAEATESATVWGDYATHLEAAIKDIITLGRGPSGSWLSKEMALIGERAIKREGEE